MAAANAAAEFDAGSALLRSLWSAGPTLVGGEDVEDSVVSDQKVM